MYSIGEISTMFQLPISTIRYYDKEGLFPDLKREKSGTRKFDDQSVETLRVIECLKKSGMEIKAIKQFMLWCKEGPSTYQKRLDMFLARKQSMEEEISQLQKTLAMIEFKCWYYTKAMEEGNELFAETIPESLPDSVKKLYERSHS